MFRKNLLALSSNCLEFHMLLKVGQEIGFILMLLNMTTMKNDTDQWDPRL